MAVKIGGKKYFCFIMNQIFPNFRKKSNKESDLKICLQKREVSCFYIAIKKKITLLQTARFRFISSKYCPKEMHINFFIELLYLILIQRKNTDLKKTLYSKFSDFHDTLLGAFPANKKPAVL